MTTSEPADQWEASFRFVRSMTERDRRLARSSLLFATLSRGAVAYEFDAPCAGYQMCVNGGMRVSRPAATRPDVALYSVAAGEACALTTQSLLCGERLAARSVAEMQTELAVLPSEAFAVLMRSSAPFRDFVLRDYFGLASRLSPLVGDRTSLRYAASRPSLLR